MTYEAKQVKAQEKANKSGKSACIYETYEGYRIGFLTAKTVGSAQEVFEPIRTAAVAADDLWSPVTTARIAHNDAIFTAELNMRAFSFVDEGGTLVNARALPQQRNA